MIKHFAANEYFMLRSMFGIYILFLARVQFLLLRRNGCKIFLILKNIVHFLADFYFLGQRKLIHNLSLKFDSKSQLFSKLKLITLTIFELSERVNYIN